MQLIERDVSLHVLAESLRNAVVGNGRIALISGEAGIGKTALIEQFARQQQSARLLWGVCDALFTPRPFGPVYDMVAQTKGPLSRLTDGESNQQMIFTRCLEEFQDRPTLAIFEDIHWADEGTLDLLKFLGRRIHLTPTLLIATYRDDELSVSHPLRSLLGNLAASANTERIALSSLSLTAVQQLSQNHAVDAKALHQQTGGNPFFVTEVLAAPKEGIPATVRDAVLARVARLSLSGRAALNAAAVIGARVEPWLLKEVVQAEANAVEESLANGILLAQGNLFVFRHELSRQTILEAILPHQRVFLHQAVLDALQALPSATQDMTRLTHHAEAAHNVEAILQFAPAAARQAVTARAHRAAATLFDLTLRHADALPPTQRAQLLDEASVEYDIADRRPEAIAICREAIALWQAADQPLRHGRSLTKLALLLQITGQNGEAQEVNRAALKLLEPLTPNRELMAAYKMQAWLNLAKGHNKRGITAAEKGIALAQYFEEEEDLPPLLEIAGLCWLYIDQTKGTDYLEQSLVMAQRFDHATRAGNVYANLYSIYVDFHQFERADKIFARALPYARERDLHSVLAFMEGWRAIHKLHVGEWAAAETIGQETVQRGEVSPGCGPALIALGRLYTRRGDPEAAVTLDQALDALLKQGFRQREGMIRAARAEAAWLAGDHDQTLAEARAVFDLALSHHHQWYVGELAFWRWRAGEKVTLPEWTAAPYGLQMRGDWQAAAAEWKRMGCPYEQARALADGDNEAKIRALAIFEELGARPMAERVRQALRDAGVSTVPRGPRATTRENPFNLTNRQLEILMLLTEELTNAEIAARLNISAKTVDHHVSAVLGKLNVSSREEAAEIAHQHPHL